MKTTTAKTGPRSQTYTKFAAPLMLDPPRHSELPTICLGQGKHVLGTSDDCTIRIRAEGVQPHHAMIVAGEQRTVVKAFDSRTWVNEGPVSEMALRHGDRLSIGPLTFQVRAATPDEIPLFVPSAEDSIPDKRVTEPTELTPWFLASRAFSAIEPAGVSVARANGADVTTKPVVAVAFPQSPAAPVVKAEPTVPSPDALDLRLDEIQQKLAELRQPISTSTTSSGNGVVRLDAPAAEHRQPQLQYDDWQRRADELARQTQQLHERVSQVTEREASVERRQAQLTLENEHFVASAEATRRELNDEYNRQMSLWQEWEAAYRRTSEELSSQLQALEQRRTALLAEADRLTVERSELQRWQAEHERDRRTLAAERVQLTSDCTALQTLTAQFDAERQQQLVTMRERETQVAAERRALAPLQEELLVARQQLERDREAFLAERSSEAQRREHELHELVELRARLDDDRARQLSERMELASLRLEFDAERMSFDSERANVEIANREVTDLRARLQQAEAEVALMRPARQEGQIATSTSSLSTDESDVPQPPPVPTVVSSLTVEPHRDESRVWQTEVNPGHRRDRDETSRSSWASDVAAASNHRFWEEYSLFGSSHEPSSSSRLSSFVEPGEADRGPQFTLSASTITPVPPPIPVLPSGATMLGEAVPSDTVVETLDASRLETALAPWNHSHEANTPYVASEFELTSAEATAVVEAEPSVAETLAEVNREFGLALSSDAVAEPDVQPVQLPGWWNTSPSSDPPQVSQDIPSLDTQDEFGAGRFPTESSAIDAFDSAPRPSEPIDALTSLRAQLAQMFDIKSGLSTSEDAVEPAGEDLEATAPLAGAESKQHEASSCRLNEPAAVPDPSCVEQVPEPITAMVESQPDCQPLPQPSVTAEEAPEPIHEDSVETFMARLLARNRGESETAAVEAATQSARSLHQTETTQRASLEASTAIASTETVDLNDRSHLKAEPKHKQDRQAAREHLQSFREVAHQSARSALARHTSKHLKNAVIVKSVLFGVSTLAAAAFLGGPLVGMRSQLWKGLACSLATLLSGIELGRSWLQLRRWKVAGKSNGELSISLTSSTEIPTTEADASQAGSAKDVP